MRNLRGRRDGYLTIIVLQVVNSIKSLTNCRYIKWREGDQAFGSYSVILFKVKNLELHLLTEPLKYWRLSGAVL